MMQLINMEPGSQHTAVGAQNPDHCHNTRLSTEEETEACEGSLGMLA